MRNETELSYGWRFTRGTADGAQAVGFDDSEWSEVRVPHDWAIAGPFGSDIDEQETRILEDGQERVEAHTGRTGGLPHVGQAWYRQRFGVPAEPEGTRVRIEFDGVMSHSAVYVNGQLAGRWPYGYSSFAFDITELVHPGENLVAVSVDNKPHSSRWYPGAGIYRNVRVVITSDIAVAHWGVSLTTPVVDRSEAQVAVSTRVLGRKGPAGINLETVIMDPDGAEVATQTSEANIGGQHEFEQLIPVPGPRLWSASAPELYTARTIVREGGEVVDQLDTKFGIRSIEFTAAEGFLVNGQAERLNGVCMHHDLGPLGSAVNAHAVRRQVEILKAMGCNSIRTSHNPPAPELLEVCDELGLYVIDEAFDEWREAKCDNGYHILFDEWCERDLENMIMRDRNHPCVVMWSIGNEIREQTLPDGFKLAEFLSGVCRRLDPTRPTTAGFNSSEQAIDNGLAAAVDVPGWNYRPIDYARYRAQHPDWPMYGSETASTVSSRGEYYLPAEEEKPTDRENLQVNSFDLSTTAWSTTPDQEFTALDENPTIMGEYVWTGFDYLGEPTPYYHQWPSRSSYFGIVDLAGIPKSRYWLYKSRWSDEPVLYLHPHWTWPGHEGRTVPVHCYTNHASVELFVNDVSQGQRARHAKTLMNRHRLVWPAVEYQAGTLRAVAYDEDGNAVDEFVIRTAGPAAGIVLTADRQRITGDGNDMAFIRVSVVDADGTLVPNAADNLSFQIAGPAEIAGVCNGDATSVQPMSGPQLTSRAEMSAFHGECVVYLRSLRAGAGTCTVSVHADGLPEARVELAVGPE